MTASATILLIFEIIGTTSFAISGAITAINKKMDIFGVAILGLTTAVGGGVIRDLILGNTPPIMFKNPVYAFVAIAVSIILFFKHIRNLLQKNSKIYETVLLIMDSVGLGVFTVVGISVSYDKFYSNAFLLIFVGVVTGIGGGVLRDIFAGDTPYVFVKHVYATASIIGAIVCVVCFKYLGEIFAMVLGSLTIVILRLLAARYHWSLPKQK